MRTNKALEKLESVATAAVRLGLFCAWPSLVAIALGATLFAATHAELLPVMIDNKLTAAQRLVGLGYFAGSLAAIAALYIAVLVYRYRDQWPPGYERARKLHPYLSFLLSGPALVALSRPKFESQHVWLTWLYIVLVILAWAPTLWAWSNQGLSITRARKLTERQRDLVSLALVLLIWAGYSYFFSHLAIINHHAFKMRTIDLGIYDNIFYQSSHGRPLGCTLVRGGTHASAHFDPILVVLSPLYLLWPRAEMLLVLQSVWLGAGAVAAYLLGRHALDSRAWGLVWALVYAVHPALHGANLYEFHSLTLLITPLLFALYFLFTRRFKLYFGTLLVLLLVREDVALLMCFVGFYAVITEQPGYRAAGWLTILVAFAYFVVAKSVFMEAPGLFNQGPGAHGYTYYYKDMIPNGEGARDFLTTLLTNPAFVIELATEHRKIHYILVMFVPLLFLPAWAGRARVMLLYGLVFILLASKYPVFKPHFQYSAILLPVAIALAPVGLRRLQERRPDSRFLKTGIMGCVLVASALVSWKFGAIVENSSFRGGYRPIVRSLSPQQEARYADFLELVRPIEPDASVSVGDRVGAHVSNRAEVYRLKQKKTTDYYLVDKKDLKGWTKDWMTKREEKGEIELIGRAHSCSLYRAVTPADAE